MADIKASKQSTYKVVFLCYLIATSAHAGPLPKSPHLGGSIQTSTLFVDDHGLFIEPTSFAYSYSTFVYERIHFVAPLRYEAGYKLDGCSEDDSERLKAEINQVMIHLQESLKTRIEPYKSPVLEAHRDKRAIVVLALLAASAAMSLGVSLYNSYQIQEVQFHANQAIDEINSLSEMARKTPWKLNEITDRVNNMSIIFPQIGSKINTIIATLDCEQSRSSFFRSLDREIQSDIVLRVTSGINALYSGKITPDFYPIKSVRNNLLKRDDMVNSLYNDDVSLVYKLGNFVTLQVSHHPFTITGILILPRLLRENIGMILSVNKVPIPSLGDSLMILNEPDVAIKDHTANVIWTPDISHCIKHTGTYFCPLYDVKSKYSPCLTNIVFSGTNTGCAYRASRGEPTVKQTNNGLLISSLIDVYSVLGRDKDGHVVTSTIDISNRPNCTFLTVMDGREIVVNDTVYMLSIDTVNEVRDIAFMNPLVNRTIDDLIIPNFDPIEHIEEYKGHHLRYIGLGLSTFQVGMMIFMAGLTYITYKQQITINRATYKIQMLERSPLI